MKHWYHKPNPLLSAYVRTALIVEGFLDQDTNALPIVTSGMSALLFRSLKDDAGYEQNIQMSLTAATIPDNFWIINDKETVIACFFKPFALASLFNIHAKTLKENTVELCNLNPHKFNALKTQLIYAEPTARKIEVLENLLIEQLNLHKHTCEIVQYATNQIMHHSGKEILAELLEELNLTERTFQRIFKKFVGVTPTQYRRICQFQLSFGQLKSNQFNKIATVAFENGFADQSHFIRSFKEFTQTTPKDYLQNGLPSK